LLLVATPVLVLAVAGHGAHLTPAQAESARVGAAASKGTFAEVLLALAVIALAARGVGAFFRRWLGQPAVMGEIAAGIALGPSVLGAVSPSAQAWVLPPGAAPAVGTIANLGVVLFLFLVGLELDVRALARSSRATLAIAHAGIAAPLVLGAALGLWLYPRYGSADVSFGVFALFLGVSMSVTAFPVLARLLTDRGMHRTPVGALALACAAVGDATAWLLLALVEALAAARSSGVASALLGSAAFVGVALLVARPVLARLAAREEATAGPVSRGALGLALVLALAGAAATERIGIHALFGSFFVGVVAPHAGKLAEGLRERVEDLVVVLFLPAFFAFTGLRTELGLVATASDWLVCGVIVAVATAGKLGGTVVASRAAGLEWREAGTLGVLMNTRGLMELVVLHVGLELGAITPTLFSMLVVMALVTTFATAPLLRLVRAPASHAPPRG
jgi:Kef-type K+ transport system membrane component KefB